MQVVHMQVEPFDAGGSKRRFNHAQAMIGDQLRHRGIRNGIHRDQSNTPTGAFAGSRRMRSVSGAQ